MARSREHFVGSPLETIATQPAQRGSVDASRAIAVGDVLLGKLQVEEELGRGGMGVVYRARHMQLGETVAIKVLHPDVSRSAASVSRLEREARAMARLRSRHVARVLDLATLDDGRPVLILEHLTGSDLRTNLRRRGALPIDEAIVLVLQACAAMTAAHAIGIVHRDLKPENLFLVTDQDESVLKVLDFGIAKLVDASTAGGAENGPRSITEASVLLGSLAYMSPEQIRSPASADARSDIWSLGIVLFELATGALPFGGDSTGAIVAAIAAEPPDFSAAETAAIPADVLAIIRACLEKDPARRPASASDLAERLRAASRGHGPRPSPGTDLRSAWVVGLGLVGLAAAALLAPRHGASAAPLPDTTSAEVATAPKASPPAPLAPRASADAEATANEPAAHAPRELASPSPSQRRGGGSAAAQTRKPAHTEQPAAPEAASALDAAIERRK